MKDKYQYLIDKALCSREYAYVPYSNFAVGAALLSSTGKIFTGCNVESASYSVCNCAERTAVFKAVSEGERDFLAIAVVGGEKNEPVKNLCLPCGVCRQALQEFCDPHVFEVVLFDGEGIKVIKFSELFPLPFILTK